MKTSARSLLTAVASWVFDRVAPAAPTEPGPPASDRPTPATNGYEEGLAWALDRWLALVDRLPGANAAERVLLRALKRRLEAVSAPDGDEPPLVVSGAADIDNGAVRARELTLADLVQARLERSMEQTPVQSRTAFFTALVERLTPDETRILAALSDGTGYPLIHVGHGSAFGGEMTRVLENLTSIGRPAGVTALELVPRYVTNLRALGLVETAAEDSSLAIGYEILEADVEVRVRVEQMQAKRQRPRIVRRTLRLAPLGAELWSACQPSYDEQP